MPSPRPVHLLFVCLGNICRSPTAEGVFLHLARETQLSDRFVVDSAGTGAWHAGQRADPRSRATALRRGVELPSIARQIVAADFAKFDHIIVMDEENERDVLDLGAPRAKVRRLLTFHPNPTTLDVPDPYSGGDEGFERVFDMIEEACRGMLKELTP